MQCHWQFLIHQQSVSVFQRCRSNTLQVLEQLRNSVPLVKFYFCKLNKNYFLLLELLLFCCFSACYYNTVLSGGMVACTSWFFLDLACTWSYISHSAFSTVSSSINSKESRNHDYFTVLVLAFGFVQSTNRFTQCLKINF